MTKQNKLTIELLKDAVTKLETGQWVTQHVYSTKTDSIDAGHGQIISLIKEMSINIQFFENKYRAGIDTAQENGDETVMVPHV